MPRFRKLLSPGGRGDRASDDGDRSRSPSLVERLWLQRPSSQADRAPHSAEPSEPPLQLSATTVPTTSSPPVEYSLPTTALPTAPSPPEEDSPPGPPSVQARLWAKAYEELKSKEEKVVVRYEEILSAESTQESQGDWCRLEDVVRAGLEKTRKESEVYEGIHTAKDAISSVKGILATAARTTQEGAAAWGVICFGLEILANPVNEHVANRKGISYVMRRTDLYWAMADSYFLVGPASPSSGIHISQLEKAFVELYAKLLVYQMRSVIRYRRNVLSRLPRDFIKLDDWEGQLDDIHKAEGRFDTDCARYDASESRLILEGISARQQNQEDCACREDLFETNPLDDKARIEDLKGGLRPEVFSWVVKNAEFQQWKEDAQARLLWIKGDPGKGKTMLMCGIINKLNVELHGDKTRPLSFYFCEANDAARSSATSVLRGLICHLVDQNTALLRHVRREHERWGGKQFKDKNAWQVMKRILVSILNDEDLGEVTLAIDALDECRTDLPLLLGLIADKSILPRTKWVVSSRDWPRIGQALERVMGGRKLSLELNEDAIAKAVSTYIDIQVEELADRQGYDEGTRTAVQTYLDRNAHIPNSTFLWVALVCRELAEAQVWETEETLKKYPPGLDAAYERMMEHIRESTSADLYIQILATTFTAYRPLALCELPVLIDQLENYKDRVDTLSKIIGSCGSFLTVRAGSVYFVHQSAKDFLRGSDIMPPRGVEAVHHIIFSRSLGAILGDAAGPRGSGRRASWELRRDPYGLRKPGIPIEQVSTPDPDPIGPVRYSCAYWVDHLEDSHPPTSSEDLAEGGLVDRFLKQKFLYWVEALSLMHILAEGVLATRKLEGIAINAKAPIVDHARDGYRFVLYNREVIEAIPLQAYMSALAFCPLESRIGFAEELPQHYRPVSGVDETWGHCLHTLQCRSGEATTQEDSVASMASTANLLAAILYNGTVRIWNPETGICLQIIEIPRELYVTNGSMALSADDKLLAIGFRSTLDGIKLLVWDPSTGERLLSIEAENHDMDALVYLDDRHLAAIQKNLFTLWDSTTGECREVVQLFESPDSPEMNNVAAISPDGRAAAALPPTRTTSGDHCHRIGLWDANRDMYTLEGHGEMVKSLAFSPDGLRLVSASWTSIKLWDSASGACVGTLDTNLTRIAYISLTQDNRVLWFSAEGLNLWDLATDSSLEYPVAQVTKAQFLGNKRQIAVARLGVSFGGSTIMILDDFVFAQKRMRYDTRTETLRLYSSADGSVLVSKNLDRRGPRKLLHWDPKTGAYLRSIRTDAEMRVILENSRLSYIVRKLGDDGNGVIELYGLMTDEHLLTLPWSAGKPHITSETVSADGRNLILGLRTGALEIWDVAAKTCAGRIQCARTGGSWTTHISVACSQDGRMLLTAIETDFGRLVLEVWDLNTSSCVGTIEEFKGLAYRFSMAISMDGQLVAVILDRGGFSIAIWNVHKGERLLTIEGFTNDDSFMSFSTTGPLRLQTDLGVWNLPPALLRGKESSVSAHELEFHGYGVTADLAWIVKGTEKIIWIPYDYRGHIVVRRSRVVFGVAGRVVIFNLPADDVFAKDFGPSI